MNFEAPPGHLAFSPTHGHGHSPTDQDGRFEPAPTDPARLPLTVEKNCGPANAGEPLPARMYGANGLGGQGGYAGESTYCPTIPLCRQVGVGINTGVGMNCMPVSQGNSIGGVGVGGMGNHPSLGGPRMDVNSPEHQMTCIEPAMLHVMNTYRSSEQSIYGAPLLAPSLAQNQPANDMMSSTGADCASYLPAESHGHHSEVPDGPVAPSQQQQGRQSGDNDGGNNGDGGNNDEQPGNDHQPPVYAGQHQQNRYTQLTISAEGTGDDRPKVTTTIMCDKGDKHRKSKCSGGLANRLKANLYWLPNRKGGSARNPVTGIESDRYLTLFVHDAPSSAIPVELHIQVTDDRDEYLELRGKAVDKVGLANDSYDQIGCGVGDSPGMESMDSRLAQPSFSPALHSPNGIGVGAGPSAASSAEAPTNVGSGTSAGWATGMESNFSLEIYSVPSSNASVAGTYVIGGPSDDPDHYHPTVWYENDPGSHPGF